LAVIKSLLDPDEKKPEEIKIETTEKSANDAAVDEIFESHFAGIESPPSESVEPGNLLEISEPTDDELISLEKPQETEIVEESAADQTAAPFDYSESRFNQPGEIFNAETKHQDPLTEIENEQIYDEPLAGFPKDEMNFDLPVETTVEKHSHEHGEVLSETADSQFSFAKANDMPNFNLPDDAEAEKKASDDSGLLFQPPVEPQSVLETARQSGLAYAAAITLFASVVFMLIIGWFADLLLGSSPWGIVFGIVLGGFIGFLQFFKITSQIFKNKD
jgi:F0F1-type ATP synthase assembly protein I